MIEASSLVVRRGGRVVVDGVDFRAATGEVTGVVGPNGSGKSTLLGALFRAIAVEDGSIFAAGEPLSSLTRREIARRIAVVTQHADDTLPVTVDDAVRLGRLSHRGFLGGASPDDEEAVTEALAAVGMSEHRDVLVENLSGGEAQRVVIARALATRAPYLLLDEPTNHLDLRHQFDVLEIARRVPATTVVVLHDLNLAARFCDRLVLLDAGRVVASGTPDEVLDPATLTDVYGVLVSRVPHRDGFLIAYDSPYQAGTGSLVTPRRSSIMTEIRTTTATETFADLLQTWDAQQAAYIAYREQRFEAMARFIASALGRPPTRILDVACGPGSLSARLHDAFPDAHITSVDKDPVLLRIARETAARDSDSHVIDVDLDRDGWCELLPFSSYDAVVSSTALHWLAPERLVGVYRDIAGLLPSGGVFANADHLDFPAHQPVLAQVAAEDDRAEQQRALAAGALGWDDWWARAKATGALDEEFELRSRVWHEHAAPQKVGLPFHLAALNDAGFAECSSVWQFLNDYVVAAVR